MWEHASVSRSASDPDALVAALDERAAQGWEVLAIAPRGDGQLVAILRRERSGEESAPAGDDATSGLVGAGSGAALGSSGGAGASGFETAGSSLGGGGSQPEPERYGAGASSWAASQDQPAVDPSPWAAGSSGQGAGSPPSAVQEPAGWAAAPRSSDTGAGFGSSTTPSASSPSSGGGSSLSGSAHGLPGSPPQAAPAASQPQTPANWYPDPSGRFELRYWNGSAWTEHVSRAGVQYTDPPTA